LSGGEQAGQSFDLEACRERGHRILDGVLGAVPMTVVITPYAQRRMKRRDIDDAEILEALAHPPSSHGTGQSEQRYEVAGMTTRGRVRVIYERPTRGVVLVITAYPEAE
jgi:hypothetical protein